MSYNNSRDRMYCLRIGIVYFLNVIAIISLFNNSSYQLHSYMTSVESLLGGEFTAVVFHFLSY